MGTGQKLMVGNCAAWAESLRPGLQGFLHRLHLKDQPGRYLPALGGLTSQGEEVALGFSCFALKVFYSLGWWQELDSREQAGWVRFIRSFQVQRPTEWCGSFIDPVVATYLYHRPSPREWLHFSRRRLALDHWERTRTAETKQAIATLAQVGESPEWPFANFPSSPKKIGKYLESLDWQQPWGAGAQFANLSVLLVTQGPLFLNAASQLSAIEACRDFVRKLADERTGGYFLGTVPAHGQLVNGAMKILSGLDWLEEPIHYPDRLVDTCLKCPPSADGCHLVDALYVLYRCTRQGQYREAEVSDYVCKVLQAIRKHHNLDGGFSFFVGRSQTHYYGVPVNSGRAESDLHGTLLLVWAVSMALNLLRESPPGWRVIRP